MEADSAAIFMSSGITGHAYPARLKKTGGWEHLSQKEQDPHIAASHMIHNVLWELLLPLHYLPLLPGECRESKNPRLQAFHPAAEISATEPPVVQKKASEFLYQPSSWRV